MLTSYLPGKCHRDQFPLHGGGCEGTTPQNAHRYLAMMEIIPLEDLRIKVIHKEAIVFDLFIELGER